MVTGIIDVCDFWTMRHSMPQLTNIDISGVTIAEYIEEDEWGSYRRIYHVNSIPQDVYSGCTGLTSIDFPASLTSIGAAFGGTGITAFSVDEANIEYSSLDGVLYNKNKTSLKLYPPAKEGAEFIVPETVIAIGGYSFSGCSQLTSIKLPESVTIIGQYAFAKCTGLQTIELPASVTTIWEYAFSECIALKIIELPAAITTLSAGAFYNCSELVEIYNYNPTPIEFFEINWTGFLFLLRVYFMCLKGRKSSMKNLLYGDIIDLPKWNLNSALPH